MRTIEEIDAELAAYVNAHSDPVNLDAMEAPVDELLRERCRAMGLAEGEEICRIESGACGGSERGASGGDTGVPSEGAGAPSVSDIDAHHVGRRC
jgi:hypothetical protein